MNELKCFAKICDWTSFHRPSGESLGFIPTMGALHDGHLSLVKKSLKENNKTIVSIFVNPTQFNNPNDLAGYPSTIERDKNLLKQIGCDYLITPCFEEIYPDNYQFKILEESISKNLCGKVREGHFDGVLTIVMKLLNIVNADKAYFGEKDFQQYLLIKKMAEAFFIPTQIIGCETIRETDGLAMSSRNLLLSKENRHLAPQLYKTLRESSSTETAKKTLENLDFDIDYIEEKFNRRFGAVFLGKVRLIDNVEL